MTTPRVFIIRHGETEWSLNGRHTGTTELPLTENGEKRIRATGKALVGEDRLICRTKLAHVYISPRARARRTLELLGLGLESPDAVCQAKVDITEDLAEWDYGDYEGLKSAEIRELRRSRGLDKERGWDIWRDGCEGGESPKEVEERCDRIIEKIRREWHAPAMDSGKDSGDVLCVAHGHLLRAFAMRWVGKRLEEPLSLILEAGGVGTLSYEHHSIKEPAILLGGSFVVNVVEAGTKNAHAGGPSS